MPGENNPGDCETMQPQFCVPSKIPTPNACFLFDEIYHALENAGADDEALESVEVSITDLEKAMG